MSRVAAYLTLLSFIVSTLLWAQSEAPAKQEPARSGSPTASTAQPSPPTSSTAAQPCDSTTLELIKTQKATFPLAAIEQGIQGRVWLMLSINESGDVEQVDVVSGEPILAKPAVDAAKKWKFKPFIKSGKAVKVKTKVPLDFTFSDKLMEKGVSADLSTTSPAKNTSRDSGVPAPVNADNQQPSAVPDRVRVSQGVTQGMLVYQVAPVYPSDARHNRIQGTVLLKAVIGKDGNIMDLQVVSGPKELLRAAIGAVQQWRYRPYLLMGKPVEVDTQIQVNFQLR